MKKHFSPWGATMFFHGIALIKGLYYATIRYLGMGWLLACCLACFSSLSLANTYPGENRWYYASPTNGLFKTPAETCQKFANGYNSPTNYLVNYWLTNMTAGNGSCYVTYAQRNNNIQATTNTGMGTAVYCPAGSTVSGLNCVDSCTPQQVLLDGTCQAPPDCANNQNDLFGTSYTTPSCKDVCISGCSYSKQGLCGVVTVNGVSSGYEVILGKKTGLTCSISTSNTGLPTTPQPDTTKKDCLAQGKSYGTVNGTVVCLSAGTKASAPVTNTTTTTNTTSDAQNVTTKNETTTKSTTCEGDSCTTITNNPDGTKSSKTESANDFCQSNPNSPLCQASDDLCQKNPDIPACKAWCDKPENADKVSCQEQGDPDSLANPAITENALTLNFSPSFGSVSSCPANPQLPHGWGELPYDKICDWAATYRPIVLLFAYLTSAFIIFGYREGS